MRKILLECAKGERQARPPIWIMRQAGRYLPEYRALRAKTGGFLDLCYTPDLATEVTLQPLRRFDLDAAILFSDILVVPHALGQEVWFEAGEGPRLEKFSPDLLAKLSVDRVLSHLDPVLKTVKQVRAGLADEKTLIGFCGSPWTVATYMIGGRGSSDQAAAREFALREPAQFKRLVDILVAASIEYLCAQYQAGADLLQLFESWAANMDEVSYRAFVVAPNKRIITGVRERLGDVPFIGFPRGAAGLLPLFEKETQANVVGLDYGVPLEFVDRHLDQTVCVQGNLDPLRVVAGGPQMFDRADEIISAFSNRPHIFNLGHGIVPHTPIAHVEQLVHFVKSGERPNGMV